MVQRKFSYQVMNDLSATSQMTREKWDEAITCALVQGFKQELTRSELQLYDKSSKNSPLSSEEMKRLSILFEALDDFIVVQAREVGWRMAFSTLVAERMMVWEQTRNVKRFREWGQALANAVKVLGRARPPRVTDVRWHQFRSNTKSELDVVLRRFRNFAQGRSSVDKAIFLDWFSAHVEENKGTLPNLFANLDSLVEYLKATADGGLHLAVDKPRPSPALFFDEWMGSGTGIDPEQLRQRISVLGSRPQRHR